MCYGHSPIFTGCATALVTPFTHEDTIDIPALRHLIQRQIESGIDAIVLLGTTGEPSTLTMLEREQIIQVGIESAEGRIPVIIGTGSNDTQKAIEYARQAYTLGAQGQLSVTPYYNKTTQNGLIRHYHTIMDSTPLPLILYHVPGRTGMQMTADTIMHIQQHPNAAGIKDASGQIAFTAEIIEKTHGKLPVYSGNDDMIVPIMSLGGKGVISVCSNIVPMQTKAILSACLHGCYEEAVHAQIALLPLIRLLFSQVNPIPVKASLNMMGLIEDRLRLPLTPMEGDDRKKLLNLLQGMNLA